MGSKDLCSASTHAVDNKVISTGTAGFSHLTNHCKVGEVQYVRVDLIESDNFEMTAKPSKSPASHLIN